jgi:hypothetical protein
MDSLDGGLVHGKIVALSDRDHFHNHFLFNNPVDDSDSLLSPHRACNIQ